MYGLEKHVKTLLALPEKLARRPLWIGANANRIDINIFTHTHNYITYWFIKQSPKMFPLVTNVNWACYGR